MATHTTVLLSEAVDGLNLQPNSVVIDATLGSGGHSGEILRHLGPDGTLIGIDIDPAAVAAAKETHSAPNTHFVCGNFADIRAHAQSCGVKTADAILADLGWRMEQFANGGRGFSFTTDEPLVMTFGDPADYAFTAGDIVNEWEEESIANVIYAYGEERAARRIARAIVAAREVAPIDTSVMLAEIVAKAAPRRPGKQRIHPATQTFQALRIAVNDELANLERFISESLALLNPGGRLAIISFHSIEDRIVKNAFKDAAHDQLDTLITKKPIVPEHAAIIQNPRARSAKLRLIEKHHERSH